MVIGSRMLALRDQKKLKSLKKKYSSIIFDAMRDEESKEFLFELLSKNPKHVSVVKEVCKELFEEVEGETKNSIIEILEHPLINKHYVEYLNSRSNKRKVKALLYFKSIKVIPDSEIDTVEALLDHRLHYLAHASALAILGSSKKHLHESVLIGMCKRSEDCKYTFVELLWEYWENEFISKEEKSTCFQVLLSSEEISLDMKALLVRIISSFQEHRFSIYFHDILKFLNNLELHDKQHSFQAALITALTKLDYKQAEEEIIKAISVDSKKVKLAVVKALVEFKTETAIRELAHIYNNSKKYVKKEISFAIEYDDDLSKQVLSPGASVDQINKQN